MSSVVDIFEWKLKRKKDFNVAQEGTERKAVLVISSEKFLNKRKWHFRGFKSKTTCVRVFCLISYIICHTEIAQKVVCHCTTTYSKSFKLINNEERKLLF